MAAGQSCYRGPTKAFNTKIGLSICAVIGFSSLRDELPEFRRNALEMIGSLLENPRRSHRFNYSMLSLNTGLKLFSLDHSVRPIQNRRRNREADFRRSLKIDHQLKLGGLLNRKIAGLSAF